MKKAILFLSVAIAFAASAQTNVVSSPSPRVDACESVFPSATALCYERTGMTETARQIAMLDNARDRKMEIALFRAALLREVSFNKLKSECDRQNPDDTIGLLLCIRSN
jgi:hypothetical protein